MYALHVSSLIHQLGLSSSLAKGRKVLDPVVDELTLRAVAFDAVVVDTTLRATTIGQEDAIADRTKREYSERPDETRRRST